MIPPNRSRGAKAKSRLTPAARPESVVTPVPPSAFAAGARTYRVWSDRHHMTLLQQLIATLSTEIETRMKLEQEVDEMRATLKKAGDALTHTRAREMQARHLATHDELTALSNRSYFSERLRDALDGGGGGDTHVAVVYLDLDDFKAVNDGHGHQAGDDLLKIAAARLSRVVRADDVLSRLGGDEFACLLVGSLTKAQLGRFAMKLYDAFASPCQIGKLSLEIHPSIGIAMYPEDARTPEELLKKADTAMYSAKRNHTHFAFCDCDS